MTRTTDGLRLALPLLGLLCGTGIPARAASPAPLAQIADADGDVDVVRARGGLTLDGEEDLDLFEGDTLRTAAGAHVTVSFVDQHLLKLGERTTLVIRAARTDPRTGSFTGRVSLLAGRLFASFASLGSGSGGFRVETRSAIAAVKGTTFAVEAGDADCTVAVLEGTVAASGLNARGVETGTLDVAEGQETSVTRGQPRPRSPGAFRHDVRRAWALSDLGEIRDRAREHRNLRASGGLDQLRALRRLAREGRLDRGDPRLERFLKDHPAWRERIARHAERHRRLSERRQRAHERRDTRPARRR